MRAIIAMQDLTHAVDSLSERDGRPDLIERAREIWAICSRAAAAAHTYEALKSLSNQELAARGLKRADLPRAGFDKLAKGR